MTQVIREDEKDVGFCVGGCGLPAFLGVCSGVFAFARKSAARVLASGRMIEQQPHPPIGLGRQLAAKDTRLAQARE